MSANHPAPPASRAELLERIRASSKDEVVLTEMQRLGFWPASDGKPTVEEALIRREAELTQALNEIGRDLQRMQDPAAVLRAVRKERMARARARREETKQRRARERFERAQAWHRRQQHELLYLGEGVSAGLGQSRSDQDRLARQAMPALDDAEQLARAMGISLAELRFLAYERRVARIGHYRRFALPKKTGGERIISAPMPRLKRAQYWVLDNLLVRAPVHPAAHGFLKGRSIVTNALPHVGKDVVINLDLKNFFPSIAMPRIKGVFAELGYSEQVATILALLCTEASTEEISVDGETYFVAHGVRALPQGAPSSPMLTNILCRRLDARLQGCASKLGFSYTRYADDLTFSGDESARKLAGKLLWRIKQIIAAEGFTPHPDKQHVMRSAQRQSVTGVVVNEKPAIDRATLRRFRATLYQVEKDGPDGKQWNGNPNVIDALEGYAQFIKMVDAAKGTPLLAKVKDIRTRWRNGTTGQPARGAGKANGQFRAASAQGKAPWDGWWQPGARPAPVLEKTGEQVKLEKRAAKEAAKSPTANASGDHPALKAPAGSQSAAPASKAAGKRGWFEGRPWGALVLQLILAVIVCSARNSPAPLIVALGLAFLSLRDYSAHWMRFVIAMGAVSLALRLL